MVERHRAVTEDVGIVEAKQHSGENSQFHPVSNEKSKSKNWEADESNESNESDESNESNESNRSNESANNQGKHKERNHKERKNQEKGREEDWMDSSIRMWRRWLSDEWNGGDLVEYKLTGRIAGEPKHGRGIRAKLQTGRYIMKEGRHEDEEERREDEEGRREDKEGRREDEEERCEDEEGRGEDERRVELLYREVSGELARCVTKEDVPRILHRYHDCHFAGWMIVRMLQGRYYWPTRVKDAMRYSTDCDACPRFGPLKLILNLQPMEMLGMDFLGPIKPAGVGGNQPINPAGVEGNRYILIIVDYYSRFLFAEATPTADGITVVRTLRKIAKIFGWPLAVYCDNASYFVKGQVPEELENQRVEARMRELERRQAGDGPGTGDLVLLRRFAVIKDKGKKLETRWEGPYKVTRVTKSGVSVIPEDLCTGMKRGRYAIDDVKFYITRGQNRGSDGYQPAALVLGGRGMEKGKERTTELVGGLEAEWRHALV